MYPDVQSKITGVTRLMSALPETTVGILGMQSYVLGRAFVRLASVITPEGSMRARHDELQE